MDQPILVATPLACWPDPLCAGSARLLPLQEFLEDPAALPAEATLWLGYSSPLDCVEAALHQPNGSALSLLADWQRAAEAFLRWRRQEPDRCRLLNLPLLNDAAIRQLQDVGGDGLDDAVSLDSAPASSLRLPAASPLALLLISQRRELELLYADLEAQADLFDRDPQFQLALPACADPALGEALLQQWQRSAAAAAGATVPNSLAQPSGGISQQEAELREALRSAEANHAAEVERAASAAAEAALLLREAEEERELVLLQLRQVQDELVSSFQARQQALAAAEQQAAELSACRDRLQQVEQSLEPLQQRQAQLQDELDLQRQQVASQDSSQAAELEALSQECRHLFLNSQPLASLERECIPRILTLVRQALQR